VRPACHVCQRAIPPDEGPEDFREVVIRNGLIVRACLRCWFLWPDENKLYPAFGYGRTGEKPSTAELVDLLKEALWFRRFPILETRHFRCRRCRSGA
jgi:RNA polymerase subunit RPABC4/transcription elongation factor Spt4